MTETTHPQAPDAHAAAAPDAAAYGRALIAETRRRLFKDSMPRIRKCLAQLDEEEIWHRPNAEVVSVGNLVLHLCGNVRQNIVSGLGGAPDDRVREREFSEPGPLPAADLLARLDRLMADVDRALDRLDPASLLEIRRVQGFEESAVSILVHVIEHFSYHVGQITYYVKSKKAVDLGYYAGLDLNARNG
jgi:uncharacterized damage-inducible protein DinB